MKTALTLFALVFSMSAFTQDQSSLPMSSFSPSGSTIGSLISSGMDIEKQAAHNALKDVANFEAGLLSPALNQYIKSTLERHPDLSVSDAIDALVEEANSILAKK